MKQSSTTRRRRHRSASPRAWGAIAAAAVLCPVTPSQAAAPTKYTAQVLLKRGDKLAGTSLSAPLGLEADALNDNGQLLFEAYGSSAPALVQYSGGSFTPIIAPGVVAPTTSGKWPTGGDWSPVSMNQNGDAAFTVQNFGAGLWIGTFRWDAKAGKSSAVALNGMPATGNLTFDQAGFPRPAINSHDEIAFPATLKDPAGKVTGPGLFFQGEDGKTQPMVLPGQAGSDGAVLDDAYWPTLSDDGRVSFLARRHGQLRPSAYLLEGGQITPIAVVGTVAPGGGIITEAVQTWVNNRNQNVLVQVVLNDLDNGPHALYRWSGGTLAPVVTPGQPMPGGGQFTSLSNAEPSGNANFPVEWSSVSFPNERGQHAFYGLVTDGGITRTAAYLLDTDGSLSLILKAGDTNEIGAIARVGDPDEEDGANFGGFGIALNNQGQVALMLKPVGGVGTLALLTPVAP